MMSSGDRIHPTNDWNSCKTFSLGVWSINIGDINVTIRCPCLSGLCLKDKKPWVSPWRENTWVVFYLHTSLFCQWSMVRLLIRLASLSNELMAIKLLKSLTFESNGQLCSSTNLHRRDRTAQSPAASDHSPAFSLSYRIQVMLTAPLIPPKDCAWAICNKDNYIKQPFEIPSGFGRLQLQGFGRCGSFDALLRLL